MRSLSGALRFHHTPKCRNAFVSGHSILPADECSQGILSFRYVIISLCLYFIQSSDTEAQVNHIRMNSL